MLIDGDDLTSGSLRLAEAVEERPSAFGRNDDRVRVGPGLDAKPLPNARLEKGAERLLPDVFLGVAGISHDLAA